jgi:hypothetical protein
MPQGMEILASHTIHTGKTPASHFHADFSDCVPYFSCIWPQAIAGRFDISLDLFKKSNTTGLAGNFP